MMGECLILTSKGHRHECVTLNSRMNSNHDYQLTPLLGASVYGPTFLRIENVHRSF
jgi:hypothetical protein